MSTRTILVVFLALACGAAMAVGVMQSSRPKKAGPVDVSDTESILVAVTDVPLGRVLQTSDVELRPWPKGLAPATALRSVEEAVDRAVLGQVLKDEFVLNPKLAAKSAGRGMGARIPKGWRAYTIQTSRVASNVAGFILPGNKVDVLLNMKGNRGDETGGGSTTTLLQAVEVLAVDQTTEAPAANKIDPKGLSSVTLLVTPEQVNLLDLGQNTGILTLALRNPADAESADVEIATVAGIRSRGLPPISPPTNTLDGDSPPPPTAAQTALVSTTSSSAERQAVLWTYRGNQQGRVLLTGNVDVR